MGCVANISERHDTHPYLRKHNMHGRVLHHFESPDIGLLRELRCVLVRMRCALSLRVATRQSSACVKSGKRSDILLFVFAPCISVGS